MKYLIILVALVMALSACASYTKPNMTVDLEDQTEYREANVSNRYRR